MAKSTEDLLSAANTPTSAPDTAGKSPGVRRLNNIPLYIVGTVVLGFALIIALVSASKSNQSNNAESTPEGGDATKIAASILNEMPQGGGLIQAPAVPELQYASAPMLDASAPLSLPDAPPMADMQPIDSDLDMIRQAKAQMFQEALRSKTSVNVIAASSRGSSGMYGSSPEPTNRNEMLARIAEVQQQAANAGSRAEVDAVYAQRMASIGRGNGTGGTGSPSLATPPTPATAMPVASDQNQWRLGNQVEAPNTFMIRTGSVIPATLISGINSDLPGMIQAQISQNIYDTPTGQHLLLPQGSKLVGTYSSGVNFGQRRLFVAWNRVIFPDGKALDIGSMPGTSGAGYSGFKDKVNNHYGRIWGNALMLSLVGAGITYGVDKNSNSTGNETTVAGSLSESLGQTFGQVVTQSIQKNMNISPTLEIRPGYRFNIIITKDIDFSKPYRSFDY